VKPFRFFCEVRHLESPDGRTITGWGKRGNLDWAAGRV
jgi:hypothetical protein